MVALSTEELHAALFGTWTAVGRIAELLIQRAALSREELGALLTAAAMTATDRQSRVGIAIVSGIIESAVRHDRRTGSAPPSGAVTDQVVENGLQMRATLAADRHPERPAEGRMMPWREASDSPIVKGSDFDDAMLPRRCTETIGESDMRKISGDPRSDRAPAPALPQRITDRAVRREDASLLETAL
jgi:hypothetical protein